MAELKVIFMDAGQGDSTLILFPDSNKTNWLIDCGSIKNGQVVAPEIAKVLNRELPSRGNRIHRLIITHPDQDHYNLLSGITPHATIDQIVYGGHIDQYQNKLDKNFTYNLLVKYGTNAISPNAKANWSPATIGGVDVKFLASNASGNISDTNNNSIVVMLTYQTYKFLLMGDAEKPTEDFILANWSATDLTSDFGVALKMGHHGSDSSSSEAWIKAVRPTALCVSADTRGFGKYQRSMPSNSKINNAVTWSGRVADFTSLSHCYVVWCDDCATTSNFYEKPMLLGPTQKAICTSLYSLKYNVPFYTTFESIGGSWYFIVSDNGSVTVQWTGES